MASEGVPSPAAASDLGELQTLGKYTLQKKIGAGGMGTVYLAVDRNQKRSVAIKVLPKEKANDPVLVKRFRAEGQTGAHMEHPNIVSVFESGEIGGHLYIVMEYIEGKDAYELLRKRGILPAKRSLEIIRQAAVALQHAYERQVVHRDIKPSNLMIREGDGVVKLADMGLARIMEEDLDSRITRAGTTVGTVDYMSPEQARDSKAADIRSDIYSLGCTWYHLLTGRPPYPDGDLMNKLRAHAFQPIPDPRVLNDAIPEGIVAVMRRMMAKKADDRYQTPADLLIDLNSPVLLRSDFTADQLLKLGAATLASAPDDDGATDSPARTGIAQGASVRTLASGAANGPSARTQASSGERDEPEEVAAVTGAGGTGKRRDKASAPESLPPRNAVRGSTSATEPAAKKGRPERALPDRIDRPALQPEEPKRSINPQVLKLIGLIAIIVGVVAFAIMQFSGGGASGGSSGNPYETSVAGDGNAFDPQNTVAHNADAPPPEAPPAPTPDPVAPPVPEPMSPATVPTVPTPESVDPTPFGGVVPIAVQGGGPLPAWVWTARQITPATTKVHVVRRSSPGPNEFATLPLALAAAGPRSIIEFADVGPHALPPIAKWPAQLTLRGREGSGAVLHGAAIAVGQTSLTIEGLNLVLDPPGAAAACSVQAGQLVIRRCSVTNWSTGQEPTIHAEALGICLLEDTLVRMSGTGPAIRLRGERSAVVAGNTLLQSVGPSVLIESRDSTNDTRSVTLVATTALSSQGGIHCRHQGSSSPTVDLTLLQSRLIHLPESAEPATAVAFTGWRSPKDILEKHRPSQVQWTAEQSTLVGWPQWATLQLGASGAPTVIATEEAWAGLWQQPTAPRTLLDPVADLRELATLGGEADVSQIRTALAPVDAALGDLKSGVNYSTLPVPPHSILRHIRAFASAAHLPESLERPDPGREVRFDLKKAAQFNRFLNSAECPDGSTVIAFGSGLRTIDPVVVRQKRLQIVFEQSDDTPLTLQPGFSTEANAARPLAWFAVEDGQLTLTNGLFRLPTSTTRVYPERFLRMAGGQVAVVQCRIEAIDGTAPAIECVPSEGHAPPQLLLDRTLLLGSRNLMRVAAADSLVEIRRSILAAPAGIAVQLAAGSHGTTLSLLSSTLYSGKSALLIEPPGSGPVQILSQRNVFHGAAVMGLEADSSLVQWWGTENAYSQSMKTYLIPQGATPSAQEFERDWVTGWGAGHELNAVASPSATVLPNPPTGIEQMVATSFQLTTDCQAANLNLGAPIPLVGPQAPVTSGTPKPTAKPNGTGPGSVKPPATKPANPGF